MRIKSSSPSCPSVAAHHGRRRHFRKGDIVEVLSETEIRSLLNGQGTLDNLPFMPEMFQFCGRRCRVRSRLDKVYLDGYRYMGYLADTVVLEEIRCDGSAHACCQMGCLVLWKEVWLKPAKGPRIVLPRLLPSC